MYILFQKMIVALEAVVDDFLIIEKANCVEIKLVEE
jgi:hypothetical protein